MKKYIDIALYYYHDYRHYVPSYASAALAFYLLIMIAPATSLIAVGASFFNIDLSYFESVIQQFITSEYVDMIINILNTTNMNSVALITMILSLLAVSKGVRNMYEISKNMYGEDEDETFFTFYLYAVKVTAILLLTFLGIIGILALKPLATIFESMSKLTSLTHIILYMVFVLSLMIIYNLLSKKDIYYKDCFKASLLSSLCIVIIIYILQIYFRYSRFNTIYGSLASFIAILFVFNFCAEAFYFGMYLTYLFYIRRRNNERDISNKETGD